MAYTLSSWLVRHLVEWRQQSWSSLKLRKVSTEREREMYMYVHIIHVHVLGRLVTNLVTDYCF